MPSTAAKAACATVLLLACRSRELPRLPADAAPLVAATLIPPGPPPAPKAPPAAPATRSAFDFLANRVHAVVHQDGRLVIPAGELEFLKYVDGGWKTSWIVGEKDGGKPVAFVAGLSANLFVPLDTDGDGAGGTALGDLPLTLTMRGLAPNQRLSVFVNEKPAGTIDVKGALADHEVLLPGAALVPGENRIRLTFRAAGPIPGGHRAAAAIERIALGRHEGAVPPAGLTVSAQTLGGLAKRAFVMPGPGRLSFYAQVPRGAQLSLAYGAATPGAKVLVRVVRDGAAAHVLHEGSATAAWTQGRWDLGAVAEHAVRIDLVSRGGGVAWAEPRLLVPTTPALTASKARWDHIFVWMVDTLRADKVHVFNPKTRVETPNYDAFAADATRFAWANVPGTWSLPSHASILTGVYPSVHKATAHEARLAPAVPFIAELMQKSGYRTGLFSSNGYVSKKWGFGRGWDENRNFIRESLPNGADYLWKTAKTWMDAPANKSKPQFLYLATVEPHVVYTPRKEFLARYWNKPYNGPIKPALTGVQLGYIKAGKLKPTDTDKAYLEALHDGEITQSDAMFGAFIADLKARGLYETSVIAVISDHGDEFWEHGDVGHAQGVHQELVHVPLILRAPGVFPAGGVVQADVEAMDLFPTLLDLAGAAVPPSTQGSSLIELVDDEAGQSPRAALTQNVGVARGLKVARYRFIATGPGHLELYDERDDPREQENLAGRLPIALRQMRNVFGLLHAFENRWKKRAWGTAANVTEAFYTDAGS